MTHPESRMNRISPLVEQNSDSLPKASQIRRIARTAVFVVVALLASPAAFAAAPAAGTVGPTLGSTVSFVGTAPGTGAGAGEDTCVDGANCDVFTLTVTGQPADYANSVIQVTLDWTVPANDYDLVIHKGGANDKGVIDGPIVSSSGNGPPSTHEQAGIRPSSTGTGVYTVHVVYFATVPNADQYKGKATTTVRPPERAVNHLTDGGIRFSPSVTVKAPNTVRDGEPSSRTDFKGNHYVGGIRGVPAGVDLWYFDLNPSSATYDPLMTNPIYRGQPDSFTGKDRNAVGADGGGDIDLAVGFGTPGGQSDPTIAFSSLVAANISVGNSTNKGVVFNLNPAGNATGGAPADDREWQEFFGDHTVFLLYRTLDPVVAFVQRSTDGGFTYENAVPVGPSAQTGDIDVDQRDGTVYCFFNDGRVAVGTPTTPGGAPASYTFHQAATDPFGVGHIFFTGKVADNGTVYAAYSNDQDVFTVFSKDKGVTWSLPARVSDLPGGTNIFPWMETGTTPGSVVIAWYGSPNQAFNNNDANWKVYFAQSFNADTATPTFTQVQASDHFIHGSNISEGGLTGAANRNLIDYFQITIDPNGAAVIGYADDHNDTDGATYVTRQIAGPSLKGGSDIQLPSPIPSPAPRVGEEAPPAQPGPGGEQVTDFRQDARDTGPARVAADSPVDIVSVKYTSSLTGSTLLLSATMKVSALTALPANATYRMTFAANAPDAVLSATGDYTYGLSDRGDQFFFAVTTTAANVPTYRYGTAVRNSDGTITYTNQGIADTGSFDTAAGTLTVSVDVSKFNDLLTKAGKLPIQSGTVLAGLRGQASGGGMSDTTRGGTVFVVGGGADPTPTPSPSPSASPSPSVSPSPTVSPTPSPSASPSPSVSPSPTVTPTPSPSPSSTPLAGVLQNISARAIIQNNDNVDIGGFILRGNAPKRIVVRGIGPSLKVDNKPVAGALQDPLVEVHDSSGAILFSNDNYKDSPSAALVAEAGLSPGDDRDAALEALLPAGFYTVVVRGVNGAQGIGLAEVYDIDPFSDSKVLNLAARALVSTGDNVLIGGLILRGGSSLQVLLRGIGPTLAQSRVPQPLQDPTLTLYDVNGTVLQQNDNWMDAPNRSEIEATTLAPKDSRESAILTNLAPGNYTGIVRGVNSTTGMGLVEVYNLGPK